MPSSLTDEEKLYASVLLEEYKIRSNEISERTKNSNSWVKFTFLLFGSLLAFALGYSNGHTGWGTHIASTLNHYILLTPIPLYLFSLGILREHHYVQLNAKYIAHTIRPGIEEVLECRTILYWECFIGDHRRKKKPTLLTTETIASYICPSALLLIIILLHDMTGITRNEILLEVAINIVLLLFTIYFGIKAQVEFSKVAINCN